MPSPKSSSTKPARAASSRLSREDWLDAAFLAVVEGGFDQARVLVLAERLGVTRGSFYWHFQDHAALIDALLDRWCAQEDATREGLLKDESDDPQADLARLLEAAVTQAGPNLENVRFELALRSVGRHDAAIARVLADVDRRRMELFERKFLRMTRDERKARDLASLFYLAITASNQALSRPNTTKATKAYLMDVITRYVIGQAAPAAGTASARTPVAAKAAPRRARKA